MGTTYEQCGGEVMGLIAKLMKKWHVDLLNNEVTVNAIFAMKTNGDGEAEPAIKRQGVPCAAKIKITSTEARARGAADAELTIDQRVWEGLSDESKAALIDHELHHLELKGGEEPADDAGRPKLKARQHDFEVWGFRVIMERHASAALEYQAAKQFQDEYGQLLMWCEDSTKVG